MRKFTLFLSLLFATAMTAFAQSFADGVYEIKNADASGSRGYFVYSTEYPNTVQLSGVELGNYGSQHYTYGDSKTNSYWYLYTVESTGLRYLFNIAEGHLLSKGGDLLHTEDNGQTFYNSILSKETASPVTIEASTHRAGYYNIKVDGTHYLASSCGWSKDKNPVRLSSGQADGGNPLELIPAANVTVDATVMATVKAVIDPTAVEPELEPITVVSYSPDVEVILLETIEIEFSEPIATNIPNTSYVECPDGSQQYFLDRTIEGNILRLRIMAQTVEGTYKLNIPAGVIKSESGAEYAGGEFTFVISNTSSEDIYIDDVTITPADNSIVNSLDYILFEYPAGSNISFVSSATASVVDADGKQAASPSYTFFTKEGDNYLNINAIAIKFDAIKTPGTYTVTVAEGAFKDNNSSNISPKYVLTYTIEKGEEPEIPTNYTYFEGTNNHDVRALISFTIADADTEKTMTVEDIQVSGGKSPIFVDKTDNVFEVAAGATLYFEEFNWAGEWMHAYAYIDYNNDFIFNTTLNVEGATDGELVSYNSYNDKSSLGDAVSGGSLNAGNYGGSKGLPYFVLPHKIATGDYRMRIKIDWNRLDANFGDAVENNPKTYGGCQCDFTIRVVEDEPAVDTAIDNVNVEDVKVIYDVTGRRIEKITRPGIYIVNGIKVLVK